GFLMAGFAPSIVTALGGVREGGWVVISIFTAVVCLISAGAALSGLVSTIAVMEISCGAAGTG
ncbi:hypothetical protein C6A85_13330, partial [Mycobacterium sp. ITM-2017-0098]